LSQPSQRIPGLAAGENTFGKRPLFILSKRASQTHTDIMQSIQVGWCVTALSAQKGYKHAIGEQCVTTVVMG